MVLVRSSSVTRHHRLVAYKQHLFLTDSEAESPRSGCQCGGRGAVLRDDCLLIVPHTAEGARELYGVSSTTNSILTKHLPQPPLSNNITQSTRISTYDFGAGGTQTFRHSNHPLNFI